MHALDCTCGKQTSDYEDIPDVNKYIDDVTIAMFCLSEESIVTPITSNVLLLIHEILGYLFQDDILNAIKLFLFSRGGDVHQGFSK